MGGPSSTKTGSLPVAGSGGNRSDQVIPEHVSVMPKAGAWLFPADHAVQEAARNAPRRRSHDRLARVGKEPQSRQVQPPRARRSTRSLSKA